MSKKIIIAGGGTGGHIFPAIAIANKLKEIDPTVDVLFIGAKGKMEMEKVPQAGYAIKGLDIAGFNRSSLIKNLSLPFKIIKSFVQVSGIMKSFQPDAVIGVGGYSTFPVLRYAQSKGIKTFIHESNSFAGKANIMLGQKANKIFVAGKEMDKFFPADRIVYTGNPVRKNIVNSNISREEGIRFFELDPAKKTVLVIGGSLGAKTINETIAASIDQFGNTDIQLIWQTGKLFIEQAKKITVGKKGIWTSDFISNMEYAFAAADVVISRAGAMAVSELCIVQKPVIFVPFPFATEDHQTVNAQQLVKEQAALMVSDKDAPEQLMNELLKLVFDQQQQEILKQNIHKLAVSNADEIIAREIWDSIK